MSSSSGISWGKVTLTAAPSVAAKLRLVARFAALAGFDDVLISFAISSRVCAWGLSSAGRAVALQASGHRFDPDRLHHAAEISNR